MSASSTGRLVLVIGPSGSGKNTVVCELCARRDDVWYSISATTRTPRTGERDGIDYRFVTEKDFDTLVADGGLLEWASYAGSRYGTPAAPVDQHRAEGTHVVCVVEIDGVAQIRQVRPDAIVVFVQPPSWDVLEARLKGRGTENDGQLERRLAIARQEMNDGPLVADIVIVNDDLSVATEQLSSLLDRP